MSPLCILLTLHTLRKVLEDKRAEVEFLFSGEEGGQMEADWQQLISAED